MGDIVKDRADWLLDAVATSTQDRQFLRDDEQYNDIAGEAILLNGEKAMRQVEKDAFLAGVKAGLEAAARWAEDAELATYAHLTKNGGLTIKPAADAIRAIDPHTIIPVTEGADG